jgi:hypothetical protein
MYGDYDIDYNIKLFILYGAIYTNTTHIRDIDTAMRRQWAYHMLRL